MASSFSLGFSSRSATGVGNIWEQMNNDILALEVDCSNNSMIESIQSKFSNLIINFFGRSVGVWLPYSLFDTNIRLEVIPDPKSHIMLCRDEKSWFRKDFISLVNWPMLIVFLIIMGLVRILLYDKVIAHNSFFRSLSSWSRSIDHSCQPSLAS